MIYIAGQRKANLAFPSDDRSMSKRTKSSAPKRTLTEKAYLSIKEGIVRREIGEGMGLQLRGEFFNAFNHPQFNATASSDTVTVGISQLRQHSLGKRPQHYSIALKVSF